MQTTRPANPKPNIRHTVWLLLGYGLLAALLTWPTVARLTTHLPGDGGDDPAIAWNLWWLKYALLNAPQNPFQTGMMFYPLGINLAFYTLTVLNAVTALPLTLNLGVVAASNLHTLATFAVGGLGAFLLARYLLAASRMVAPSRVVWAGAALAGGFYAFASSKLFYVALGQFNIASSHWLPFIVLYVIRARHRPQRLKNAVLAGLFLTLQAWAEMTYASFALVFIGLYWLYWLVTSRARRLSLPQLTAAGVLLAVFAGGIAPILAQMLPDMAAEGDFLVEGGGFADAFSADLLGFVIPTQLHPLLGNLITHTGIVAFNKGQHIYVGVMLLGLALLAAITGYRRAETRFWLLAALVFALLALGPVITFNGHATGLPGPFVLLQQLPFFKGNRYPSRYSVLLMLSLSVLTAFALAWLGQRLRARPALAGGLLALAGALFLFEHLSAPLPQSDMRAPAPYQIIAADPAPVAVLDIPFAWRNGFRITGALTTQFMFGQFYQTAYQKPLLQGNTSRNPEFKFRYFTQAPLLNSLLALETGKTLPPERLAADRALAADVLRFFNIGYIVVRPDAGGSLIVTPQATIPYIEALLPVEKIQADDSLTLYRVNPGSPPASIDITPDSPLAPLYFGEGWGLVLPGRPVTAQRQAARLLLPLTGEAQQLSLRLAAPEQVDGQTVSLALNGWQSPQQPVGSEPSTLTFALPAGIARPGVNTVWLNFGQIAPPPADGTVMSAGEEVGDYGHIYVNGREVSPNERGYNAAIITAAGVQTANFDTHADPAASARLAEFLAAAPPGATIALAAADEASANLSEAAVQAIRQATGAAGDLRGCFRCSHALIRTADGQLLEQLDALRPVAVSTAFGLTEPAVAVWLESVTIE
ncbi:MAG: hypothetical protein FOGNACKC_02343 [Anaerolineae bacterium]|nr:hypothetical protein [Anaerolineae bacterium]